MNSLVLKLLKLIISTWGGYSVYKSYPIDNVISHEADNTRKLLMHNSQQDCNLYIPEINYASLGRPDSIKFYKGEFKNNDISYKNDIICLNLISKMYDLVLLLGFKFTTPKNTSKYEKHKILAYQHNVQTIIQNAKNIQFVLINYRGKLNKDFSDIANLSQDSLTTAMGLLD